MFFLVSYTYQVYVFTCYVKIKSLSRFETTYFSKTHMYDSDLTFFSADLGFFWPGNVWRKTLIDLPSKLLLQLSNNGNKISMRSSYKSAFN